MQSNKKWVPFWFTGRLGGSQFIGSREDWTRVASLLINECGETIDNLLNARLAEHNNSRIRTSECEFALPPNAGIKPNKTYYSQTLRGWAGIIKNDLSL